jgi:hypothetical protein
MSIYKYFAIVHTRTKRIHNIQEIVEFAVLFVNAKTAEPVHSYHSEVKPRLIKPRDYRIYDEETYPTYAPNFSTVIERFNAECDWLLNEDVLFITIGNQVLHKIVPGQLAIESAHLAGPALHFGPSPHFGPSAWCNLLWVFERLTRVKLHISDSNAEIRNMMLHLNLDPMAIEDSEDYCKAVGIILQELLRKTSALSLSHTCSVKYDDSLRMKTPSIFNMSFVRM